MRSRSTTPRSPRSDNGRSNSISITRSAASRQPDFPGGLVPNHALNGTPELAYGITDWWEIGFYAPFAVNGSGAFLSNGAKIRNLFVVPHAGERKFFYGVNFELSYETPTFSQTPLCARNPTDHRGAQQRLGIHRQSDCRYRISERSAKRIFCPRHDLRAISARTASSASNTIPISARSKTFCHLSSSGNRYSA